ncbi:hypothetical protein BKA70DRAFT_1450290 [Coprinopsis sp. MPI-PUGE-AT-0042]|nr:hypothetical protein BKA70DRAFT_1450290 [Coprinopsis sp. MPI-PUGE-AT-0042]
MIPNARLNSYVHDSNNPLPEGLRVPLSNLLDQLRAQDRACDHDRRRIEDAIEKRQSQIQALEYEIEGLRVVHKQVINNKASIAIRETQYKATLSPLRRIPPEVIARIMQFAIESDEEYTGQLQRADFKKLRAAERFARTLTSWFSRGGENAPLSLCLSWVSIEHATWAIQLLRILEINITTAAVYLESNNWHKGGYYGLKFLELSSPESGGIFPVRDMEIWFGLPYRARRTNDRERINITRHCPNLSTLSLFCIGKLCPTSVTHQTLSTLLLTNAYLPADEVEFMVAGLPRLEVLRLTACTPLWFDRGEASELGAPYSHSSLKRFELHGGVLEPFLSRLRCPSLTILIASGDPPGEMDRGLQLACLQRFIKRSGLSIPFTFYGEARRASER